jgi:hypothetical protein
MRTEAEYGGLLKLIARFICSLQCLGLIMETTVFRGWWCLSLLSDNLFWCTALLGVMN